MEKRDYKEKYGFEDNSDKVAGTLWRRLREFVPHEEMKQFCSRLFTISKLEYNLQGKNSPTQKQVANRAKQYFTKVVPQIYDRLMASFQSELNKYYPYEDCGPLEIFEQGQHSFLSLEGIAEQIEDVIRRKYKHD